MADDGNEKQQLQHKMRNLQSENQALKHFLGDAAERLEEVVEQDCDEEAKDAALISAKRLRRAASYNSGSSK